MKNAGTVLMYNCSGEQFSKLKQIFAMLRLRMRVVEPDRYHIPLEELSRGKGEPGEAAEPLPEAMLVFCGLGQALLNQVLEVIRVGQSAPHPARRRCSLRPTGSGTPGSSTQSCAESQVLGEQEVSVQNHCE